MFKIIIQKTPILSFICFCAIVNMSPAYSMLEEAKNDLESATRKVTRILNKASNGEKHAFEEGRIFRTVHLSGHYSETSEQRSTGRQLNEYGCKNCGKSKDECWGLNGGKSLLIKHKTEELNGLLAGMENSN
jgi:hypothetical protein